MRSCVAFPAQGQRAPKQKLLPGGIAADPRQNTLLQHFEQARHRRHDGGTNGRQVPVQTIRAGEIGLRAQDDRQDEAGHMLVGMGQRQKGQEDLILQVIETAQQRMRAPRALDRIFPCDSITPLGIPLVPEV